MSTLVSMESFNVSIEFLYKDHQRMMVDPMFIIVQNLSLFLTAVTPTAVAQTAVVLRKSLR